MSIDNDKFQFIEIFGDPVDRLFGLLEPFAPGGAVAGIASVQCLSARGC